MPMVPRTNVGDDKFLEDQIHKIDYRRDVQAIDQRGCDLRRDIYGPGPVIFEGLTVEDGASGDKFKILAGRCHDNGGNHIVLDSDVDDIDDAYENVTIDTSGKLNYIALKYKPDYSNPAGFAGAVNTGAPYYKITADYYDIYIGTSLFDEDSGFVNLATAWKDGGVWYYDHGIDIRSRSFIPLNSSIFTMTFAYSGPITSTPIFLERHGISADIHSVPGEFDTRRLTAKQDDVSTEPTIIDIYKNGTSLQVGLRIEIGETFGECGTDQGLHPPATYNYDRDDLIRFNAHNDQALIPTGLVVNIAGYITDIV